MMCKNVMIPQFLLERIIEFLDCLDIPERHELSYEYGDILWALKVKIQKLELKEAYSKIILAGDEENRDLLQIRHLQQRDLLNDMEDDEIF